MKSSKKGGVSFHRFESYAWFLAVVWTVVVAASLVLNVLQMKRETLEAARIQARAAYEKDIIYRRWNSNYSGIYVPITEKSQPNPYLSDIEERDITTPSGIQLTLMNPAYMTRQVHELAEEKYGVRGHITSLDPIRPENAPDPWEAEALQAFERGETEISSLEEMKGEEYLRLMRPLITEKSCLKCHAAQGYQEGDVRGGISVSMPMEPLKAIAVKPMITVGLGHALLWLIGMGGIVLGTQQLRRNESDRRLAVEVLQKAKNELETIVEERTSELKITNEQLRRDITERKKAEERLLRETERTKLLLELYLKAPQFTDKDLYDYVLEKTVYLTESNIGFFHQVADDQKTIILTTWNSEALKNCTANYDIHYSIDHAGNWVDCVRFKRPVIYNDFPNSPNRKGLPEGHTPLKRFMSIPVMDGEKVRFIFGVGNKTEDYDEHDVAQLQLVANEMHKIIMRRRAEEELRKYREHLEELIKERTSELEKKSDELQQAIIQVQEADRLKSVFLASMSHELRTPLNSIIGFTGIILEGMSGEISDEQRKQLTVVESSADHLLGLINDVLDVSKIEAGKVELFIKEFGINDVVGDVVETLSPRVREKDLEILTDLPEEIKIFSDKKRVKQVLLNLVTNAVKFTDRGSVNITAKILNDKNLEIRVIDTGIGIKKDDMNKLFTPFQQIDMSSKKSYEGTGLGLHLSRKLANLMGGDISAESEYGKGSEFILTIPLKISNVKSFMNKEGKV